MIQVSDDIVLYPLSVDDIFKIFNTLDSERDYMREWLPFVDTTKGAEDTENYVKYVLQTADKQFTIYYKEQFVGLVGYKDTDFDNHKTEIGYWISQYAQGKGIMIQSVKKLVEHAFTEMDMNRVQIKVAIENKKSRRIPEKLGFQIEGIEREGELLVDNVYTDIAIYSLLKREYLK
ncbi:ribosomal-protein-serine acetyltransferase [Dysgonomonas sp. PFB1-18]|uniref:GNAT family N-acetyltransferase n=1 Tax=unclassified Dysgonomonas TaxID=2630389 RepID=UPI002477249C|nr:MULTISPECIES: GNAT family protein [unclassified Dysgonomonas]MDH6307868.1 ribosomal-protein-serine acetyltransferase [Dysgonomonas sp. PF1-14]MDH6337786.1 ribosomal-protein-serine acetyltransferase [Dysgonomonas sp. PF1-16]MDH6379010.1 ribosomal-protein-serine acetyltransferase [Dysgonomonas sp. PFB1-18]MDH6396645.1 ribosomal-protein-serine acetyltransferase [Dysgonomonas sp. PF1-23]